MSDAFTVCMFRTTHSVAQWLCTTHLLMCIDTETNPGPEENKQHSADHGVEIRTQVLYGMQMYTANIYTMIDEKWGKLDRMEFPSFHS